MVSSILRGTGQGTGARHRLRALVRSVVCAAKSTEAAAFYRWKKVYAGLGVGELRRVKQLEKENRKLKQLVADLSLDNQILKELFAKKGWALPQKGN